MDYTTSQTSSGEGHRRILYPSFGGKTKGSRRPLIHLSTRPEYRSTIDYIGDVLSSLRSRGQVRNRGVRENYLVPGTFPPSVEEGTSIR